MTPANRPALASDWRPVERDDTRDRSVKTHGCTFDVGLARYVPCGQPPVIVHRHGGCPARCGAHLSGRWIEDGQVWTTERSEVTT